MGSFNTRCFLTHQTIKPNDDVVIFPLMQQSGYNPVMVHAHGQSPDQAMAMMAPTHSTCYSDAFWSFSAPMLRGHYADYGEMTLDDTPDNEHALRTFFNHLHDKAMVTQEGENTHHEKAFDFQSLYHPNSTYTFNELTERFQVVEEAIQKQRVYVQTYRGVVVAGLAVASAIAFEEMIHTMEHMKAWNGSITTREDKKEAAWGPIIEWLESEESYKDSMPWSHRFQRATRFRSEAHIGFTHAYEINERMLETMLKQYFDSRDSQELRQALFELSDISMDMQYFLNGLEYFELKVQPLTYAGQDYSNEIGRTYHAYMGRVEAKIRETLDLDDEDNEEEDAA